MTKIIGLCGPQGAGKSTLATAAVLRLRRTGRTARIVSFAHPIKMMMKALLITSGGMTNDEAWHALTDSEAKEMPLEALGFRTPRQAMRWLGTEWGRDLMHPDLWLKLALMNIANLVPVDVVLIDDVRFDSEVEAIITKGGSIVEISRIGVAYDPAHISAARPVFTHGEPIPLYNSGTVGEVANLMLRRLNLDS